MLLFRKVIVGHLTTARNVRKLAIPARLPPQVQRRPTQLAGIRPLSSAGPNPSQKVEEAIAWVQREAQTDYELAEEIIATLTKMGMPDTALLSTLKSMGPQGLKALSSSVQSSMKEKGLEKIKVNVKVPRDSYAFEVEGFEGDNFRTLVDRHTELVDFMECACGGNMACSTCHVIVCPDWFKKVGPPSEEEQDMIDLAYEPVDNSRLGCQITLTKQLNGLQVTLPDQVNNLF